MREQAEKSAIPSFRLSPALRGEGRGEGKSLGRRRDLFSSESFFPSPQPSPRKAGERGKEGIGLIFPGRLWPPRWSQNQKTSKPETRNKHMLPSLAVVGATGAVGDLMRQVLLSAISR